MFADAVAKLSASIFPIFFACEGDTGPIISVSGTGFFIDDDGYFVTADHTVNCAPAGSTYFYYGNLPDQVSEPAIEIEQVAREPEHDLYLGRIGRNSTRGVDFSGETVRPGNSVCLSGYPMADVSMDTDRRVVANVRRYWQPTFVVDVTEAVVGDRSYQGYLVGHPCFSGMSGGPVFDMEGKVRGMAVATFTRSEPELTGGLSTVKNGIVLQAEHILAFLERERTSFGSRLGTRAGR